MILLQLSFEQQAKCKPLVRISSNLKKRNYGSNLFQKYMSKVKSVHSITPSIPHTECFHLMRQIVEYPLKHSNSSDNLETLHLSPLKAAFYSKGVKSFTEIYPVKTKGLLTIPFGLPSQTNRRACYPRGNAGRGKVIRIMYRKKKVKYSQFFTKIPKNLWENRNLRQLFLSKLQFFSKKARRSLAVSLNSSRETMVQSIFPTEMNMSHGQFLRIPYPPVSANTCTLCLSPTGIRGRGFFVGKRLPPLYSLLLQVPIIKLSMLANHVGTYKFGQEDCHKFEELTKQADNKKIIHKIENSYGNKCRSPKFYNNLRREHFLHSHDNKLIGLKKQSFFTSEKSKLDQKLLEKTKTNNQVKNLSGSLIKRKNKIVKTQIEQRDKKNLMNNFVFKKFTFFENKVYLHWYTTYLFCEYLRYLQIDQKLTTFHKNISTFNFSAYSASPLVDLACLLRKPSGTASHTLASLCKVSEAKQTEEDAKQVAITAKLPYLSTFTQQNPFQIWKTERSILSSQYTPFSTEPSHMYGERQNYTRFDNKINKSNLPLIRSSMAVGNLSPTESVLKNSINPIESKGSLFQESMIPLLAQSDQITFVTDCKRDCEILDQPNSFVSNENISDPSTLSGFAMLGLLSSGNLTSGMACCPLPSVWNAGQATSTDSSMTFKEPFMAPFKSHKRKRIVFNKRSLTLSKDLINEVLLSFTQESTSVTRWQFSVNFFKKGKRIVSFSQLKKYNEALSTKLVDINFLSVPRKRIHTSFGIWDSVTSCHSFISIIRQDTFIGQTLSKFAPTVGGKVSTRLNFAQSTDHHIPFLLLSLFCKPYITCLHSIPKLRNVRDSIPYLSFAMKGTASPYIAKLRYGMLSTQNKKIRLANFIRPLNRLRYLRYSLGEVGYAYQPNFHSDSTYQFNLTIRSTSLINIKISSFRRIASQLSQPACFAFLPGQQAIPKVRACEVDKPSLHSIPNLRYVRDIKKQAPVSKDFLAQKKYRETNGEESRHYEIFPGQLITYGDTIANNIVTTESGQVLYIDSHKTTLRKAQTVLIYSQAIITVLSGEWIKKGTPLMSLSYQKVVTGDIVQGLPKIEQFFEAPLLKDGNFWSDSLQAKLNQFFQEQRELLPLAEAVRKGFSEIQRVLVEGVQRVYISQGVLIADKHLEVIVRQMTCKGRILYSGDTGFLRNELVSLDKIEHVNQVTYGQKALYHPQVRGITDASLESESFLSAASFQETTRVLSRDAIVGKTDLMRGLKERVIVGELIQAGTALANNSVYNLL